MKRTLDETFEEPTQGASKKKKEDHADNMREALTSILLQTGFDLSDGFDFEHLAPLDEEAIQSKARETLAVPRLITAEMVNGNLIRLPRSLQDVDDYLDLAGTLRDIPQKVEEIPDIIAAKTEGERVLRRIRIMALWCQSDDDLLKLEDEFRFVMSSPEAQWEMAKDDLDEIEIEADMDIIQGDLDGLKMEVGMEMERMEPPEEDEECEFGDEGDAETELDADKKDALFEDIRSHLYIGDDGDAEMELNAEEKDDPFHDIRLYLNTEEESAPIEEEWTNVGSVVRLATTEETHVPKRDKIHEAVLHRLGCSEDGKSVEQMSSEQEKDDAVIAATLRKCGCFD